MEGIEALRSGSILGYSVITVIFRAGTDVFLGRQLVAERLAACVNLIGPIRSIYRWRDTIEDEHEYLLLIKTSGRLFRKLTRRVHELHSYEGPGVMARRPDDASNP